MCGGNINKRNGDFLESYGPAVLAKIGIREVAEGRTGLRAYLRAT